MRKCNVTLQHNMM